MSNMQEGHDKKKFTISVNGRPKEVSNNELSFEDIVKLAFPNPPSGGNIVFTVTFRGANEDPSQGTLVAGETVEIKDGTKFDVTATDKS
jgi:Multiubiquitin